jgi:chromosome segregation ATPase
MMIKTLAVTAAAAVALTVPAHAAPEAKGPHCVSSYSALTPEQQARLDARMAAVDARLAHLDAEIQARVAAKVGAATRRADVQARVAEAQAEVASRQAEIIAARFSPERIRAITARAEAQAQAGVHAAAAAEAAMRALQPRLDALAREMGDINVDVQIDN